jgi:hypothetical protein
VPHESKAVKHVDVLSAALEIRSTMSSISGLTITFGANCGSIKTTSAPIAFIYTVADQENGFRMFIASEYGVGAYLPEHQVWTLGGDTLVEAGEHVDGTFAADAAV